MSNIDKFPDFLIVGAAKSGTSSLHHYLAEHPDIFLPKEKELYFWQIRKNPNQAILHYYEGRKPIPLTLNDYQDNFLDAKDGQKIGEACPSYLYYYNHTIASLRELHPTYKQTKIVIILRDPVDRIFSEYRFVQKKNLDPEPLTIQQSLEFEPSRLKENKLLADLFYTDVSSYSKQVQAYLETFDSVKVILYDDLKKDAFGLCRNLCDFIGVSPFKLPDVGAKAHNQAKTRKEIHPIGKAIRPIFVRLWCLLPDGVLKSRLRSIMYIDRKIEITGMEPAFLKELYSRFTQEIQELEGVTGLNLEQWKTRYEKKIREYTDQLHL